MKIHFLFDTNEVDDEMKEYLQSALNVSPQVIEFEFSNNNWPSNSEKNTFLSVDKNRSKILEEQLHESIENADAILVRKWYQESTKKYFEPTLFNLEEPSLFAKIRDGEQLNKLKDTLGFYLFTELSQVFPSWDIKLLEQEKEKQGIGLLGTKLYGAFKALITMWGFDRFDEENLLKLEPLHQVKELFISFHSFRQEEKISKGDYVICLTDKPLPEDHLFYLLDPSFANNILISVPGLLGSGGVNPHSIIAFFVARGLLSKLMFSCFAGWYLNHHPKNSRCIMHRCDTPDKLRDMISHGDICEQCEQYLRQNLPSQQQVSVLLNILESASNNTKRRSLFLSENAPLPIVIKGYRLELYLNNCGTLKRIPLYPKERALYLTYLLFEEGLDRHSLAEHKELILKLYGRMVNIDDKEIIRDRINSLIDLEKNDFSISKSRINKAFSSLFNVNPILAKLYQIEGTNGEVRSIRLERTFVFSDEELPIENNFAKFQSNGIAFDMQNDHLAKIIDKENWSTSHFRSDYIPTFPSSGFDSFKPESSQELTFNWESAEEIQFAPISEVEDANPDEVDENATAKGVED